MINFFLPRSKIINCLAKITLNEIILEVFHKKYKLLNIYE